MKDVSENELIIGDYVNFRVHRDTEFCHVAVVVGENNDYDFVSDQGVYTKFIRIKVLSYPYLHGLNPDKVVISKFDYNLKLMPSEKALLWMLEN